eukprot:XP_011668968.1 PREDICTED: T-complex protein 1 subunit zeta [Strongylocentrotus purpuratus]
MAAIKALNPKAEVARAAAALAVNTSAARGLQDVLRTNLGPKGTIKMLVSGSGDIKLTKDGNVLLHEMQIQHPTASMIAKVATAQDDITGDGTTSNVLIIGELLKQADLYISEGLHPRIVTEGFELAKEKALETLESVKVTQEINRDLLISVASTSLRTKVHPQLADLLTEVVVDAVLAIQKPNEPIDLHMVEIMQMQHRSDTDTSLVRGLVMDHGARHPNMKKRVEKSYILTCNVSMEYEKSEVNAGFFYKSAEEREKLVQAERAFTDEKVQKVIDLKRKVCEGNDRGFVVINQKVCIMIIIPNRHTLTQIKDATHDGFRAVKNAIDDGSVVPGAGALEVAIYATLQKFKETVKGRARLGVQAYAEALLVIPKVLAQNSGLDAQETMVKLLEEYAECGQPVGVDISSGEAVVAATAGIWDNYCVKKQILHSCTVIASNLLLVDEIMRAGLSSLKNGGG